MDEILEKINIIYDKINNINNISNQLNKQNQPSKICFVINEQSVELNMIDMIVKNEQMKNFIGNKTTITFNDIDNISNDCSIVILIIYSATIKLPTENVILETIKKINTSVKIFPIFLGYGTLANDVTFITTRKQILKGIYDINKYSYNEEPVIFGSNTSSQIIKIDKEGNPIDFKSLLFDPLVEFINS